MILLVFYFYHVVHVTQVVLTYRNKLTIKVNICFDLNIFLIFINIHLVYTEYTTDTFSSHSVAIPHVRRWHTVLPLLFNVQYPVTGRSSVLMYWRPRRILRFHTSILLNPAKTEWIWFGSRVNLARERFPSLQVRGRGSDIECADVVRDSMSIIRQPTASCQWRTTSARSPAHVFTTYEDCARVVTTLAEKSWNNWRRHSSLAPVWTTATLFLSAFPRRHWCHFSARRTLPPD